MSERITIENNISRIREYLITISDMATSKIDDNNEYILIRKNISHSDLISSGKRTKLSEPFSKNYLYYLTVDEMEELDRINSRPFATAHQSNIGMPKNILYNFINVADPGNGEDVRVNINKYANVYLVKDTLKYFNIEYTMQVLKKLNKVPNWNIDELKYDLPYDFTRIDLSIAAHGIGCAENEVFHKLRRSVFKSDEIILLLEKKGTEKNIYVMFNKNPKFYTLIGEYDESWEKHLRIQGKQSLLQLTLKENLSEEEKEKTRNNQNKWRKKLAEEMMSYTTVDDEVFCPMTYVSGNFSSVGTLFRASHIKAYNECTPDEAFDVNNGILISANADALFDKHLITIEEDGTIKLSYLVENEGPKFKQELKLTEKTFKAILNEKREKYLKRHREVFEEMEIKRKQGNCIDIDSSDEKQL